MRTLAVLCLLAGTLHGLPARADDGAPAVRPGAVHAVPLYGDVVHVYDAPENPYAPGHRGVDVAAPLGTTVRASADGTVSFAGNVAGNRTVSVDHGGGLKTTYSYLATISVAAGQTIARGVPVGTVGTGHPGSELPPHTHLSARRDDVYFDPLTLYVGDSYADLLAVVE